MFRKILWSASIAGLAFVAVTGLITAWRKPVEPSQNTRLIADKKAKTRIQCTPLTNKNCFTLTPAQLQRIKKIQNGLSRKND